MQFKKQIYNYLKDPKNQKEAIGWIIKAIGKIIQFLGLEKSQRKAFLKKEINNFVRSAGDLDYANIPLGGKSKLTPPHQFFDKKIMYNQLDVGRMSCTNEAKNTGMSNNYLNSIMSLSDRVNGRNKLKSRGSSDERGGYVHTAVEEGEIELKEKGFNVKTNRNNINSLDLDLNLNLDYIMIGGIYANPDYIQDFIEDGDIDNTKFTKDGWGHCICMFKHYGVYYIIENYNGKYDYNLISITPEIFKKLRENGFFFNNWYFYENLGQETQEELDDYENAIQEDLISNKDPNKPITRKNCAKVGYRILKKCRKEMKEEIRKEIKKLESNNKKGITKK